MALARETSLLTRTECIESSQLKSPQANLNFFDSPETEAKKVWSNKIKFYGNQLALCIFIGLHTVIPNDTPQFFVTRIYILYFTES